MISSDMVVCWRVFSIQMNSLIDKLFSLLGIYTCIGCQAEGQMLCGDCANKLILFSPHCFYCEQYDPRGCTHARCRIGTTFNSTLVLFRYNSIVRALFRFCKYKGAWRYKRIIEELVAWYVSVDPFHLCFELMQRGERLAIIPLSMHQNKLRERGFSLADFFAHAIAVAIQKKHATCSVRIWRQVITKSRETEQQAGLRKDERFRNQQRVFAIDSEQEVAILQAWQPTTILVVDDVASSGATVHSFLEVLSKTLPDELTTNTPKILATFARG